MTQKRQLSSLLKNIKHFYVKENMIYFI